MFCSKCGKEVQEEWKICPSCGGNINTYGTKEKSKANDLNSTGGKIQTKKKHKVLKTLLIIIAVIIGYNVFTYDFSPQLNSLRPSTNPDDYKNEKTESDDDVTNSGTLNEYLENCLRVENTELARNSEKYEGKDILLEGELNILADEIVIGWFEDTDIIKVNYTGKAIDTAGNEIGNIVSGDYGIVAGRYGNQDSLGHKYIDAAIIILEKK